ncbi:MAG: response regulator, partial [Candidatus Symbiothrix sp.]|nr:response regulator [Candidatus Symbiothrix sp.]
QRSIVFYRLPPGKYTFKVKASSVKNTWDNSNIRSLEIVVKPPFYYSAWAFLLYAVLITGIVWQLFRFYYHRLKEKNEIRVNQLEKEKLEEMNDLKRKFFTNISHEFKTPLSLIIAPVQRIMNESNVSDAIKKHLELVLKNSNSLMSLLKELIDFNKMESGRLRLKLQKGNPLMFVREICSRFQVLALDDEIDFETEIEDLEEEVWFELSAVEKIINNLLSNAFKYTQQGGTVRLIAFITEDDQRNLFLKLIVSDTGMGIDKEEQLKIFEPYYRVEKENTSRKAGWGIGLALTRNLVQLHKGSIHLESEPGKGSTFTVLLNVSPDSFSPEDKMELRADHSYFRKYNYRNVVSEEQLQLLSLNGRQKELEKRNQILLVEDNVKMLQFLIDLFSEKYDVCTAGNGKEAILKMEEKLPDFLISDIVMPEMDGTELCRLVKSNLMTSHIPVILLTAITGTEDVIRAYELGADMYVEKPFNPSTLLLQVQNLLRTRDNNRRQFKESMASNIGMVAKNKYDRKLLNDIQKVVEDNIGNEEFNVSDIVKAVGISRTMLHVKLKSMLDMSIGDYIRNIRIEKAKDLLMQGDSIANTAYDTGFSDPNYFSKCFKKQTGKTPSEFVKDARP